MQRTVVRAALAALALVATAHAAEAQIRFPRTQLIVGAGRAEDFRLGEMALDEGSSFAYHHPTTTFNVGLQTASPLRGVDLRATFQYARPRMDIGSTTGNSNAYRTSMKMLVLDAVVRGPRILDAQLYALGGVGVRHFDFKQSYLNDAEQIVGDDQLAPVLHVGAGLSWTVGRYDLFVEGGDYIGSFPRDVRLNGASVGRDDHQPAWTVGFRIPIN